MTEIQSLQSRAAHELCHLILDLLEEESMEDASETRTLLDTDPDADIAVDSLRMVSIVLELETRLGIVIGNDELTTERLRSVTAFADFLHGKVTTANENVAVTTR